MKVLVVVDMQNDFVDGALGTTDAEKIVPKAAKKIRSFQGRVIFTKDTHGEDYLKTLEGKNLPVTHCVRNTKGWEICPEIEKLRKEEPVEKPAFGSISLGQVLKEADQQEKIESVTLIGICTDICVISNAILLKAFLPETEIIVDAACCAGTTPENHKRALEAMKVCQIKIENI